jgi:hypothetical protein
MSKAKNPQEDQDLQKGAVENDRRDDEQEADRDDLALTPDGLPADPVAIAQNRLGVNVDDSEVAKASETGQSVDGPSDEESELEQLSASTVQDEGNRAVKQRPQRP